MDQVSASSSATRPISVGNFITFGWETFKKRGWFLVGAILTFIIASWIIGFANSFILGSVGSATNSWFVIVISFVISTAINTLLGLGWMAFFLKAHDDVTTATVSDFWHPSKFWSFLATNLLYGLIVIVGYILFIVPGIIATVAFMFATYFVVDKGMGPIEALKASARITKGNRMRLLALFAAGMLISLFGALALIVGLLVAIPVITLASVHAYRRLSAAADASEQPQSLSGGEVVLLIVGLILPVIFFVGIMSSIVLASLSSAREKGRAVQTEMNLQMAQLGLELYASIHGTYPVALSAVTQDPNIFPGGGPASENFTYSQLGEGTSYELCALQPTYSGTDCVTPEDLEGVPFQ